jgi:hypothetical protein
MKFMALLLAAAVALACVPRALAQDGRETDPAEALAAALAAACRANEAQFANYLTAESAAAFKQLTPDQRRQFLERFALSEDAGRPLLSSDEKNHTVLRCVAPAATAEFRFGDARVHENLAFIPVSVVDSQDTQFGLVREGGGWRLISLGLVMLDIPQLSQQWAASAVQSHEDTAVANVRAIADAVHTYKEAWGKMPESLAQLGPAPKNQISPDQASLVSQQLASGSADGYKFRYRIVGNGEDNPESFEISAVPEDYGKTGARSFLLDSDGKIHAADHKGNVATAEDDAIP